MSLLAGALAWILWMAAIAAAVWWILARVHRRLERARAEREARALGQARKALEEWRRRRGDAGGEGEA